jgi:drug/metabolite transporter (DMT)-like permease
MNLKIVSMSLLCVLLLSIGQLLFKAGANSLKYEASLVELIIGIVTNVWVVLAIFIYSVATILWVIVLRMAPLSTVYPIMSISFVLVPLLSVVVFKEPISWQIIVSSIFIIFGVVLVRGGVH